MSSRAVAMHSNSLHISCQSYPLGSYRQGFGVSYRQGLGVSLCEQISHVSFLFLLLQIPASQLSLVHNFKKFFTSNWVSRSPFYNAPVICSLVATVPPPPPRTHQRGRVGNSQAKVWGNYFSSVPPPPTYRGNDGVLTLGSLPQ